MGEFAELVIDGWLCQVCGQLIDKTGPGFPRTCRECSEEDPPAAHADETPSECGDKTSPEQIPK